ncbi:MAG: Hsp20/alpha crystallin family protein [Thermacetogeniaceae bacterium]
MNWSVNRNPFESLKDIPFFVEEFFKELSEKDWPLPGEFFSGMGQGKWPPLNVVETADELVITAAIPGLRHEGDVSVYLKGNVLTIEGAVLPEHHGFAAVKVHVQEQRERKFSRTINLPVAVDARGSRASYRRGILEIRLPKLGGSYAQSLKIEFQK